MIWRAIALAGAITSIAALVGPGQALAAPVGCGQVITKNTTLQSDLNCPGSGLVIGHSGITLNLNGHTVKSTADCTTTCSPGIGIDNSGGYDRVRILNGAVSYPGSQCFTPPNQNQNCGRGIVLAGATRNKLSGLTLTAGFPAIQLSNSDHNRISATTVSGGFVIHIGSAIEFENGSDDNVLADSTTRFANGLVSISDSAGNRLLRDTLAFRNGPDVELNGAPGTRVLSSHLTQRGISAESSDGSVIAHNDVVGQISISGNGYRVADNSVSGEVENQHGYEHKGIDVVDGDGNIVRGNEVSLASDGIAVEAAATHALLIGNLATQPASCLSNLLLACDDGIDVDAPGTFIRGNVATNNGDYGIEAVPGVIDGGRNRASGNGNPQQCLNVRCR